tara:strand:+ start:1337 stop:1711 length:375 start_codon:yes stop_codon:yes gene_type:complete
MEEVFISPKIKVKPSPLHGMGVFAIEPIQKGETIEVCYYTPILFSNLKDSVLKKYWFATEKRIVIVWGYGSIYNHSFEPNIKFVDPPKDFIVFSAIKNIEIGEELTHCYVKDKNAFNKHYLDKN